jgi:hypothetical protein
MKTVKTTTPTEKKFNWAIPGQTVTHDKFMSAIKQAETGPFYTVQESMQHFEQWLKSREKK